MELTIIERIVLFNLLPKEGNFKTLKMVRQIREAASLQKDEQDSIVQEAGPDGQVRIGLDAKKAPMDPEGKEIPKDITLSEAKVEYVAEVLTELDKKEKLPDDAFTLYEKFVVEPAERKIVEDANKVDDAAKAESVRTRSRL